MVKFSTLAVTAVATLSGFVSARDCQEGIQYCGWDLEVLDYNKYTPIMNRTLTEADKDIEKEKYHSLFKCIDNGNDLELGIFCGDGRCDSMTSKNCDYGPNDCCIITHTF
ncbi:hypothetical protein PG993_010486 [Apiospora rasikravindrae]|uniref:Uncharacterized protein n=1 Tax=Apiospora rasikravindrae TaxID=990691 RepID=A0ABR1SMC7_9PEZI